jgi:hypothetical protein
MPNILDMNESGKKIIVIMVKVMRDLPWVKLRSAPRSAINDACLLLFETEQFLQLADISQSAEFICSTGAVLLQLLAP